MALNDETPPPSKEPSSSLTALLSGSNAIDTEALHLDGNASAPNADEDTDPFQPLLETLDLDQLAKIAVCARQSRKIQPDDLERPPARSAYGVEPDEASLTCEVLLPPILGGYNAVYVLQFSDSTKWIARIPGKAAPPSGFTELDGRRMETDLRTMQFIRNKTSIPLPEVFAWETTCNNSLGLPYALMSFVPGRPISSIWFGHEANIEARRLKCLEQIAKYMSQFHVLKFDKIGSLCFDKQGNVAGVGDFVRLDAPDLGDEDPWGQMYTTAPFDNMKAFLLDDWDNCDDGDCPAWSRQEIKLVRMAIDSIPDSLAHDGSFTLTPPDFDSQNILVDDEGNVTGFIDWDSVMTQPRVLGYCRYPTFLTRDWDPAMYAYDDDDDDDEDEDGEGKGEEGNWENEEGGPERQEQKAKAEKEVEEVEEGDDEGEEEEHTFRENSPEELAHYRQIYADIFANLGLPADDFSANDTRLSHIVEAIEIAAASRICRSPIVEKLLQHAFNGNVPFTYPELLQALEDGDSKGKEWMRQIRDHFASMW